MSFSLSHPAIQQAIERGLIRPDDLNPRPPASPTTTTTKPVKKAPPEVRTTTAARWSITLTLGCRVVSEANLRSHWAVACRRAEVQAGALHEAITAAGLSNCKPPLPLSITWTRTGRQQLDGDNLQRAFKALRDRLAGWLQVDDGSDLVTWNYDQRRGEPGVELELRSRTP